MTSLGSIPAEQRWRDTMRSMGCHVTPASVAGIPRVDEDGFLTIRFGDHVKMAAGSIPAIRVSCTLRLGEKSRSDRLSRWIIEKTFISSVVSGGIRICVELDLLLAGGVRTASFQAQGSGLYAHIQALILDARDTLSELPVSGDIVMGRDDAGPIVHIEAVAVGDLLAGRSGIVRSSCSSFSKGEIALRVAACDALAYEIVPGVVKALHAGVSAEASIVPATPDGQRTGTAVYERVIASSQPLDYLSPL
jgi:hypothetical protein